MKLLLSAVLSALVFCSCSDMSATKQKDLAPKKTYDQIVDEQIAANKTPQPAFLNFQLGGSKKDAEKNLRQLLKDGKLREKTSINYSALGMKIDGYQYSLALSQDTIYEC